MKEPIADEALRRIVAGTAFDHREDLAPGAEGWMVRIATELLAARARLAQLPGPLVPPISSKLRGTLAYVFTDDGAHEQLWLAEPLPRLFLERFTPAGRVRLECRLEFGAYFPGCEQARWAVFRELAREAI
jgi:hypothetical protein